MEGPESQTNNGGGTRLSENIKCEIDSGSESVKTSGQYVGDEVRPNNSLISTVDDRSRDGLLDNSERIEKAAREMFVDRPEVFSSISNLKMNTNGLGNKTNKIKQIIEETISMDSKQTILEILEQVNHLSSSEKLLLYLKLPSGNNQSIDPLRQPLNPLGSRFEIHQTITWIKTHLEEDQDVSLPKQDVYDEYIAYCNNNVMKPLSTADFGKVMKQVFPSVRPRRLGTRGNSRYCYAGMRKRTTLQVPLLPDLGQHLPKLEGSECPEDKVLTAAGCLIREWAEKLLSVKFASVQDLACHLVENTCVDARSAAACTLLSALEPRNKLDEKGTISPVLQPARQVNKHRETQMQLQRKLQEREVIREQKRKLQDQQQSCVGKSRTKRAKLSQQNSAEDKDATLPTASTPPTANHTQEDDALPPTLPSFAPYWPQSDCDTKQAPPINKLLTSYQAQNGPKEFVDYSTISLSSNASSKVSGDGQDQTSHTDIPQSTIHMLGVTSSRDEDAKFLVSNDHSLTAHKMSNPSGNPCSFNLKSRHLSLELDSNVSLALSGRQSALAGSTVVDKEQVEPPKSSLRFYLEQSLVKKSPNLSPNRSDLSSEFAPHLSQSQSPSIHSSSVPSPLSSSAVCSPQTVGKVAIPRLAKPRKETAGSMIILPPAPMVQLSPNNKYKRIQPKVDALSTDEICQARSITMGKEGSAFISPKTLTKKSAAKNKTCLNNVKNSKASVRRSKVAKCSSNSQIDFITSNDASSRLTCKDSLTPRNCDTVATNRNVPPRHRNEVSIGSLDKDALDDYLHGGGNSQEQEEELMQYFQQNNVDADKHKACEVKTSTPENVTGKAEELSQLRLLLERNLNSNRRPPTESTLTADETDEYASNRHSASQSLSILSQRNQLTRCKPNLVLPSGTRRRVSFETSVPQSPNTRRMTFSFTPISPGPHSPLGRIPSKPSSANASPFVSPRNTPVFRSRNNSGQANGQSSYLPSYVNSSLGGTRAQLLNTGMNVNGSHNGMICNTGQAGQRNQCPGTSFTGQSSSLAGSSIANSLSNLVAARALSQNISNSKSDGSSELRQNMKFQRSNSVNSELTSTYPRMKLQNGPLSVNTVAASNYLKHTQVNCDSNTFVIPSDSQIRSFNVSASAPQSPMIHYPMNTNPFVKMRSNSFEGPNTNLLLEDLLNEKSTRESPSDQFMGAPGSVLDRTGNGVDNEANTMGILEPLLDQTTPLVLNTVQKDPLAHEVSQFFSDDSLYEKTIPNFAQLQYRSQSVPLHRMASALVSPISARHAFNFSSMAPTPVDDSMAPTPVPSEYQDFSSDILLDGEQAVGDGLDTENLNQIFNLLDAQHKTQLCIDMNENESVVKLDVENDQNGLGPDEDNILFVQNSMQNNCNTTEVNLAQGFSNSLIQNYSVGNGNITHVNGLGPEDQLTLNLEEPPVFDEAMSSLEPSPSYSDTSVPYKSTFEYVTDGSYRTFTLNAMNLRTNDSSLGARRNISLLLEPSYFTDVATLSDCDNVSQLEQQVDKL